MNSESTAATSAESASLEALHSFPMGETWAESTADAVLSYESRLRSLGPDLVGAEYCVVAGQAAFRYSLMSPSYRAEFRTRSWRWSTGGGAWVASGGRWSSDSGWSGTAGRLAAEPAQGF